MCFIPELRDPPYEEQLKDLHVGLLTLFARSIKHDITFVYELFYDKINLHASQFFTAAFGKRTKGHIFNLQINYSRPTVQCNFFSQRVVKCWKLGTIFRVTV